MSGAICASPSAMILSAARSASVTGEPSSLPSTFPDFETAQAGAVWRFLNAGNRDAFAANPEIYGPQFGGYDPIDIARGVAYAGNPRFFVVTGQRLYLFGREQSRDAFAADPAKFIKDAQARWPDLRKTLAQ